MVKNFIKNYFLALFVFTFLVSPIALVFANHTKGTYPSVGHLWMSAGTGYSGLSILHPITATVKKQVHIPE